jgi:hypothetical protein
MLSALTAYRAVFRAAARGGYAAFGIVHRGIDRLEAPLLKDRAAGAIGSPSPWSKPTWQGLRSGAQSASSAL